jgi:hypothetical protein
MKLMTYLFDKITRICLAPIYWWHYRSTYTVASNTLAYIKIAARLYHIPPRRVPRFELKDRNLYRLILKRGRSLKAQYAYAYMQADYWKDGCYVGLKRKLW